MDACCSPRAPRDLEPKGVDCADPSPTDSSSSYPSRPELARRELKARNWRRPISTPRDAGPDRRWLLGRTTRSVVRLISRADEAVLRASTNRSTTTPCSPTTCGCSPSTTECAGAHLAARVSLGLDPGLGRAGLRGVRGRSSPLPTKAGRHPPRPFPPLAGTGGLARRPSIASSRGAARLARVI